MAYVRADAEASYPKESGAGLQRNACSRHLVGTMYGREIPHTSDNCYWIETRPCARSAERWMKSGRRTTLWRSLMEAVAVILTGTRRFA